MSDRGLLVLSILLLGSLIASRPAAAGDEYFDVVVLESAGRNVAAELADLDGDGRRDLFVAVLQGIPPDDRRVLNVYLQRESGTFPVRPDHVREVPQWSAVYDIADVRPESPGEELVLLRPDRVTLLSLAAPDAPSWDLPLTGPTSTGLAEDERGFEPFKLVYDDFGDVPWILVPQIGQLSVLTPRGELVASLAVPRRANYFILPPSGLLSLESDFQIFLDVPKLMVGDIDGDGRADIASATRHEIYVFLQKDREQGTFSYEPDRRHALRMVTPRDHIRGSGGVSSEARDIDGDGRLDLLVSHVKGGFTDSVTTVHVYMNRDGRWNVEKPDQSLVNDSSLSSNTLYDVESDGKLELLRIHLRFGLLELVEALLSREIDVDLALHRFVDGEGFQEKPWIKKKLDLPFSLETFRLKGFVPTAREDVNGDGFRDFVSSGGGKEIEVYQGGPKGPFERRPSKQSMPTAGLIHFADWSGDGLLDFVIFDPHHFDAPIRLGRNLGVLPGTPPSMARRP